MSLDEARQKYIGRLMVLRWDTREQSLASYERWARRHSLHEGDAGTVVGVLDRGGEFAMQAVFCGTSAVLEILQRHLLLPEEIANDA